MIIDTHIHLVGATRALSDIGDKIKRVEDGISFVSRYPDLWRARLTDEPIDISSNLLEDMDHHNIDRALVQLTPGRGDNDMLAEMVKQHPDRFHALINTGGWSKARRAAVPRGTCPPKKGWPQLEQGQPRKFKGVWKSTAWSDWRKPARGVSRWKPTRRR